LIIKLQNLIGRTTHALLALDLLTQNDSEGFKGYAKDFTSITKEEVDEAFYFLIPEARREIYGKISDVKNYLEDKQQTYEHLSYIYTTLKSLLDMMYAISKLAWR